jgi:hypothetical protein
MIRVFSPFRQSGPLLGVLITSNTNVSFRKLFVSDGFLRAEYIYISLDEKFFSPIIIGRLNTTENHAKLTFSTFVKKKCNYSKKYRQDKR